MKLNKKQEEKRQDTLKALDICIKMMQDKDLSEEETEWIKEYFIRTGVIDG